MQARASDTVTDDQQTAFLAALDRHKALLYKVVNAYCRRREDRSDLIQDMVLELWRAWPGYDARAAVSTWMYRIAVNVAISAFRGERRRIRDALPIEDFGMDLVAADRIMDSESDDLRALHQLISRLDAVNRALILLYMEGYGQQEIADMLGISASNVATRVSRIKQRLQRDHAASETSP
ncbi:MAG: RNA polymerase sigma factor [Xanthomonadales bacterium]|nr:RNA polymerase sigma factor [Xanthomonadales bacterium]